MGYQTIIVTGGEGFVGSNLVKALVNEGHSVISLDNHLSGFSRPRLEHDNVTYVTGDAKDLYHLIDVNADLVYHLGEYARVEQSFQDFDLVYQNNTQAIHGVLQYCQRHQCKLVYSGSSTKFADELDGLAGNQQSPYAFTKAMNTELVKSYAKWYGLNYAITYFYNVYGPGEIDQGKYATLIAKFKSLYLQDKPFEIVLPGTQQRNFTHINDTVDGLIRVGLYGNGDMYGIGSDEAWSILDVVQEFEHDYNYLPARQGNRLSAPVISDKTKALGWTPKHSLKDYIASIKKEKLHG